MIWDRINPKAQGPFQRLEEDLLRGFLVGETSTWFRPFEGYRSPERQSEMLRTGRSKARPFESAHQYGLAVDYVGFVNRASPALSTGTGPAAGRWTWDATLDWDYLDKAASRQGLSRPIPWDRPHIEHGLWDRIKGYIL